MEKSVKGKVTLTKTTEINGDVWYQVFDAAGWCMGSSRNVNEADALFKTCCENYDKNGGPVYQTLQTHP